MAVDTKRMYEEKMVKSILQNKSLEQLRPGEQGVIVNVPANSFLASLGFRAKKTVKIIAKELFNGPLLCSVDGRNIAIGSDVAGKIIVNSTEK
ncbi:FeoA family protein [Proteinivorax hydrogeniformans]|uniref:FeoA family protein n=1 Tax=Proteinivorax hydrogeniformans TaxID=1826727 RepID=A0AAU8HVD0_9FIRM